MTQTRRHQVSSNFTYAKVFLVVFLIITSTQLLLNDEAIGFSETNSIIANITLYVIILFLLFYLFSRPKIEFDKVNLYIHKRREEKVVPLEFIESLNFSILGFGLNGWSYSYKVTYTDLTGKRDSFRVFPKTGSFYIEDIINETRRRNKNLHVSRFSFGLDELFQK